MRARVPLTADDVFGTVVAELRFIIKTPDGDDSTYVATCPIRSKDDPEEAVQWIADYARKSLVEIGAARAVTTRIERA